MAEEVGKLVFVPAGGGITGAAQDATSGFMGGARAGVFGGATKGIAAGIGKMIGALGLIGILLKPFSELVSTLLKPVLQILLIWGLRAFMALAKFFGTPPEDPATAIEDLGTAIKEATDPEGPGGEDITVGEGIGIAFENLQLGIAGLAVFIENIKAGFAAFMEARDWLAELFITNVSFAFGAIIEGRDSIVELLINSLTQAFEIFTEIGEWIQTYVMDPTIWAFGKLADVGTWIVTTVENAKIWAWEKLKDVGSWIYSTLSGVIDWGWSALSGLGSWLWEQVTGFISAAIQSMWSKLTGGGDGGNDTGGAASNPALNDFIMRPGQAPVSFSPDDTVVGFKGSAPNMGGGGITINISNPVLLDDEAIRTLTSRISAELQSEIGSNISYA